MQDNNSSIARTTAEITADFIGGEQSDVSMMVGVGIVKDSDAVFFQYLGDEQPPKALTMPVSGKPLTRMSNIQLVGISITENVGSFNATKLNLYVRAQSGTTIMLTSGLASLWSQYCLTGLSALFQQHPVDTVFHLDTWRGTSKMRPCFAAIRSNGVKVNDEKLKEHLLDARSDRNEDQTDKLLRDAVEGIRMLLAGNAPQAVSVQVLPPDTHDHCLEPGNDEIPF